MRKKKKGSTLVELLLYMSLLVILLVVLTDILAQALDVRLESETGASVSSDGRFILSRFMYDIGKADVIITPVLLGEQTNTLQLNSSGINYTYNLNSGDLVLTDNIGTEKLNSPGTRISNLTFKRLGNPTGKSTIQVQFTLISTTVRKSGPETKNFQTTIGMR